MSTILPGIQFLTTELISRVLEEARRSPRRRMNYNFHSGPEESAHRFLNVLLENTYIRPHRHLDPPKSEMFLVLEGKVRLWCFGEAGHVTADYTLAAGQPDLPSAIDLPPGIWHTATAVSEYAVCLEVKSGPYHPASDKEFAAWAPPEGDPSCVEVLAKLLGRQVA
jgi:cupin fold WbuC family metalloprotein